MSETFSSYRRVLFVRSDAYGDLILFEPVLRSAISRFGPGNVGLVMRSTQEDLQPLLPEGLCFFGMPFNPYVSGPFENVDSLLRMTAEISTFAPDLICIPAVQETWADLYVATSQDSAERFKNGPIYTGAEDLYHLRELVGAVLDERMPIVVSGSEETDLERAVSFMAAFVGKLQGEAAQPHCRVPSGSQARIDQWLVEEGLREKQFAVVFPAGTSNVEKKRWPADRFAQIAKFLEREHRLPVVLAGAASERVVLDEVLSSLRVLGGRAKLWIGNPGQIADLAALLARARLYVGNDTGPLHLAGAVDTPVVGIYGGGHWPRFVPAGEVSVAVAHPVPCKGCNWECLWSRPVCIDLIDVAVVEGAINRILVDAHGPRLELSSVLSANITQMMGEAAAAHARERARADERVERFQTWAIAEREKRQAAESYAESLASELTSARAWAADERNLRLEVQSLLSDAEAQRDVAQQRLEKECKLANEQIPALQEQLTAVRSELEIERVARSAAEARILKNRIRRLLSQLRRKYRDN